MDIDPIPPEPDSREDIVSSSFTLEPENAKHVALLCGHLNTHLKLIEDRLRVSVSNRGNQIKIGGPSAACASAERLLKKLYSDVTKGVRLSPETIHLQLQQADLELLQGQGATDESVLVKAIKTKRGTVKPAGIARLVTSKTFSDTTSISASVLQALAKPISPSPVLSKRCSRKT